MSFKGQAGLFGLILACAAGPLAAQGEAVAQRPAPGSLLFAWLKDNDAAHPAFLATIDSDPGSATYGQLLTTTSAEIPLRDAHHTPHSLPASGRIFANAFRDGHTFIFDTTAPHLPRLTNDFVRVDGYSYPHTFVELDNGNFLVTFQTSGENDDQPGGLVELTADGDLVRATSAATPVLEFVRPYSLEVFPELDRVVTTSSDMWGTQATEHLQLWRLSSLSLLRTFRLPPGERRNVQQIPLEIRALEGGDSALAVTWNCGLYLLSDLAGQEPVARLVWDFNSQGCAIPLRLGNYWIQAVGRAFQVVVLDISDPASPQLATVLQLPEEFQPHWLAAEPGGDRIVLTGYSRLSDRITMLRWDPAEQDLAIDDTFGTADDEVPGFFTNRIFWPHGRTGEATAHGVVFWPAN